MPATRAETIAGLRKLADLLEQHPTLPLPNPRRPIDLTCYEPEQEVIALAGIMAALGQPRGVKPAESRTAHFYLMWRLSGLKVQAKVRASLIAAEIETSPGQREWRLLPDYQAAAMAGVAS